MSDSTETTVAAEEESSRVAGTEVALWRQVLGFAVFGGLLSIFAGPVFGTLLFFVGVCTFVDAWRNGIRRFVPDELPEGVPRLFNLSPMAWAISMCGLLIVAYPAYLLLRSKIRRAKNTDLYYYLLLGLGGYILLSSLYAMLGLE